MNKAEGQALTERQHYWLNHLQACAASGTSIAEYAAAHNLATPAMYAGKKMLIKKGALPSTRPARFQRVSLTGVVASHEWSIYLPNGASVAFSGSVDAAILAVVLNATADLA
jgi:hypothetical protein